MDNWKLKEHPQLSRNNIVAVVVLDGWGEFKPDKYNCIHVADTPTMDSFKKVIVVSGLIYCFRSVFTTDFI